MAENYNVDGLPRLPVSHGVKVPANASLVYCSGQIHAESNEVGPQTLVGGTIAEKTTLILRNLEKILKAGGSSLSQLVKVNIYILNYSVFNELNEAYTKLIPDPKPARTCIAVASLPAGADIEIDLDPRRLGEDFGAREVELAKNDSRR